MENLLFTGMDITRELRKSTTKIEHYATCDMTEDQRRVYQLGVDKTISCLREILREKEYFTIHVNRLEPIELTLQELSDIYLKDILAYTE